MVRLATIPCITCQAPLRRSARAMWSACKACTRTVEAHLKREVGTRDPSAWVRALNQTFGSRDEFTRIAAAERAA